MRIGIFGGTFDPVHYGHLLLAECCREQARLDEVWFMPTPQSPHKLHQHATPAEQRIEMLGLAIAGHAAFRISRYEIDRGGVNYTVETLAHFAAEQPACELFFLMGADSLADLPNWRGPAEICTLATPLVVRRSKQQEPDFSVLAPLISAARLQAILASQVEMPGVDLSASDIRRCVAAGQSIRYRTPRAVEKYIETHGLWRD